MIQSIHHRPTTNLCGKRSWTGLGMVCVVAMVLAAPRMVRAADWLAPASDQAVTAPWVMDIAAQLEREPYRDVLTNAPGEPPHPAIVRYLNNAAHALQAGNKLLAQSYVDRTIGIFESGVLRGYYSRSEVEPINKLIRGRAEAAMKTAYEQERWTGYTEQESLGLIGEGARMNSEHPAPNK